MDVVKQARDYYSSKQNATLIPDRNFGRRKYFHVSLNGKMNFGKGGGKSGNANKQWVHPPEALLRGHIVYNVKFLGQCEVDTPKGTEVVKDAIRKMKFSKQIKKAEGQKPRKVELTISVDGVTIQDPKTKIIQYQYPLHRISYCADDKSDKRMLTFIAKESESQNHHCYVFDSDKCAEEITLSIGQAFDLAYRKFLESSGRDMDMKKQFLLLQKKVHQLTQENLQLKARIADLERSKEVQDLQHNNNVQASPVQPEVGRKLENLLLDDQFASPKPSGLVSNGTTPTQQPLLQPPPVVGRARQGSAMASPGQFTAQTPPSQGAVDAFGATPFVNNTVSSPAAPVDPFGMGAFNPAKAQSPQELDQQIQRMDRELLDLQAGFSQGLSFGTEDFSLADLDPLNQK